ncbi:hypothetical protein, partial [Mesorhizobium sp.]|uniref:hypothetical protein n=1 Tax=Mesorhizobium sp. TaxID=1871066 RepID=UPI0025E8CA8C
QQTHDDEFSDTDAEGAGGEGIKSKGHGRIRLVLKDAQVPRPDAEDRDPSSCEPVLQWAYFL